MDRRSGARAGIGALPLLVLLLALAPGALTAQAPTPSEPVATPASPVASSAPVDTGDPRSEGEGPGLVGEPLSVLLGIVLVGVATVVVTVVFARVTGRT